MIWLILLYLAASAVLGYRYVELTPDESPLHYAAMSLALPAMMLWAGAVKAWEWGREQLRQRR